MDPVTHAVIGMAVSKITGNGINLSDAASTAILIGSVFPDIDIVLQKWGDCVYLKNHRGITHSPAGLAVSAALISLGLSGIYHHANILNIFIWALVGCLSHTFFDIFNSYGAQLLWPLCEKKFSLRLLTVFDPFFIGFLTIYIFSGGFVQNIVLAAFILYLISRFLIKSGIYAEVKRNFGDKFKRVSVFPSMNGLFRWHFILEDENCNLIGEKNVFKGNIKIVHKLYKIDDEEFQKVLFSPIGEFFSSFTPLFHVNCEKVEGINRYTFIDLRYYLNDKFLHHAVLELAEDDSVIKASFNPYSINRSSYLPAWYNQKS